MGRAGSPARAEIRAKQAGVFSGSAVVEAYQSLLGKLKIVPEVKEGQDFKVGDILVRLQGAQGDLLVFERTFLNLLCHLSGVATLTREYVNAMGETSTKLLATRKTLPGLRSLQLLAVRAGGGYVHRRSLSDGILIKDNHQEAVPILELIETARRVKSPLHRIEVEVADFETLEKVLGNPPDVIMLDNFEVSDLKKAISLIDGRTEVEISGGVNLESIKVLASLGADSISVGRITHSAPSVDLSMDLYRE